MGKREVEKVFGVFQNFEEEKRKEEMDMYIMYAYI